MTGSTIFVIVATAGVILLPWAFLRDIRGRYPQLWARIGSPPIMRESSASLLGKIIRGLRDLRSDPSLTMEQRVFCRRYWWLLVLVYSMEGVAICLVAASRFHPSP